MLWEKMAQPMLDQFLRSHSISLVTYKVILEAVTAARTMKSRPRCVSSVYPHCYLFEIVQIWEEITGLKTISHDVTAVTALERERFCVSAAIKITFNPESNVLPHTHSPSVFVARQETL